MRSPEIHGKLLTVKDGWLMCPVPKKPATALHILPDTKAENLEIYCRDCKTAMQVDIAKGQSVERRSQ